MRTRQISEPAGIAATGEPTTFQGCLERVNPSQAALQQLAEQPDDTPVIMLNLLRFRPRGDDGIYRLYGREAAPEIQKVGSFIAYYGSVITDLPASLGFDTSWDAVVLPVYHRRRAYLDLQHSSAYQLAIPYRCAGTSRRMLYVLKDRLVGAQQDANTVTVAALDARRKALPTEVGNAYVIDMLRFAGSTGREQFGVWADEVQSLVRSAGGSSVLSLTSEVPVLSEALWDQCIMTRFPNRDAVSKLYSSPAWRKALDARSEALEKSSSIVTESVPLPT